MPEPDVSSTGCRSVGTPCAFAVLLGFSCSFSCSRSVAAAPRISESGLGPAVLRSMALFSVVELDAEVESGFPIGASGRLGLMCSEMNGFSDVGLREEEEEVSGSVEERGAMWVSDRVWDRVSGVGDAMVGSRGLAPRPGGERVLVLVSVGVAVLSEMVVERVFWVVVESVWVSGLMFLGLYLFIHSHRFVGQSPNASTLPPHQPQS